MAKKIYKVNGMDCTSCAMMIESDLEDAGVKARCSYAKQILEIENDGGKDEEEIKGIVKNSGYSLSTLS